jgi:hypothetical protein
VKLIAAIAGGLIGGVAGYFIGALVSCYGLFSASNLCGLVGVFATGPVGLIGGAIAGWRLVRARPGK